VGKETVAPGGPWLRGPGERLIWSCGQLQSLPRGARGGARLRQA